MQRLSEVCIGSSGQGPCGYVDESGTVVVEPKFSAAGRFAENGLAVVEYGNGYGVIDAGGEWVVAPGRFAEIQDYSSNGLAAASIAAGKEKVDGLWGVSTRLFRWGFIDGRGNWVIPPTFDNVYPFAQNGLALARAPKTGRFGFIDMQGRWVIPPRFVEAQSFGPNGLAPAREGDSYSTPDLGGGKVGYVDRTGRWIIAPAFQYAGPFAKNGLATACDVATRKCGYINSRGEWEIAPTFGHVEAFSKANRAVVRIAGEGSAIIDVRGVQVSAETFGALENFGPDGLAIASGSAEGEPDYGVLDIHGRWVVPPVFEHLGNSRHRDQAFAPNGLAWGTYEDKPRIINRQGRFLAPFDAYMVQYNAKLPKKPVVRDDWDGGMFSLDRKHGKFSLAPAWFWVFAALSLFLIALWPLLLFVGAVLVAARLMQRKAPKKMKGMKRTVTDVPG